MNEQKEVTDLHEAPLSIWLQVDPEGADPTNEFLLDGATWSESKMNDSDVEYIRAYKLAEQEREMVAVADKCCLEGSETLIAMQKQLAATQQQAKGLRKLLPTRIPNGFVSFGKNYAEQEDVFADPYNKMSKFKKAYLEECAKALSLHIDTAAIDALEARVKGLESLAQFQQRTSEDLLDKLTAAHEVIKVAKDALEEIKRLDRYEIADPVKMAKNISDDAIAKISVAIGETNATELEGK